MTKKRKKFSTQMDSELLEELKSMARSQGRQIQSIVEEAVEEYIAENTSTRPNPKMMAAAEEATKRYAKTLAYLAK